MNVVSIDLVIFTILFVLFIYVFVFNRITAVHKLYLAFHFCMMIWPLSNFLLRLTEDAFMRHHLFVIGFVSLTYVSFGWLWFTYVLIHGVKESYYVKSILSFIPFLVTTVLIVWNPIEMFYDGGGAYPVQRNYGPFFWVVFALSLTYCIAAILKIVKVLRLKQKPWLMKQLTWIAAGIGLLIGCTVLDISLNVLISGNQTVVGLTSLGVLLSDLCFIVVIQRYNLFEIIDVGLRDVIRNITSGAIITDLEHNVLHINESARRFVPVQNGDSLIQDTYDKTVMDPQFASRLREAMFQKSDHYKFEYSFHHDFVRHVTVHVASLYNRKRVRIGSVIMLQDITEMRSLIGELNEKNEELHVQNEELKQTQKQLSEANDKLKELAITDGLTGCYNRRYLNQYLSHEIVVNRRYDLPFSLLLFDIDEFKRINDTYGHQIGDEMLCIVADAVKSCLRESDMLARYGGEEFLVYLPQTEQGQAKMIAQRVRKTVEERYLETNLGSICATISIGLTTCSHDELLHAEPDDHTTQSLLDLLVARADHALYQAKQEGRNRIVVG